MEKRQIVGGIVFPVILGVLSVFLFFFLIFVLMIMRVSPSAINHYKDDNNYSEVECAVIETNYGYGDTYERIIVFKEEAEYERDYSRIELWDINTEVVEESGFWETVELNETVYVFTTDGYFWDGYRRPIVGLRTENEVFLDFETGKANQIKEMEDMRTEYLRWLIPPLSIMAVFVISGVTMAIIFNRKKN